MDDGTRVVSLHRATAEERNTGVYIGRAGQGRPGRWGNPFRVRRGCTDAERQHAVDRYRGHLWSELRAGRVALPELAALAGRTLLCFCAAKACHGDVLAEAAVWARAHGDRPLPAEPPGWVRRRRRR